MNIELKNGVNIALSILKWLKHIALVNVLFLKDYDPIKTWSF